jgi:hypothetical protein
MTSHVANRPPPPLSEIFLLFLLYFLEVVLNVKIANEFLFGFRHLIEFLLFGFR